MRASAGAPAFLPGRPTCSPRPDGQGRPREKGQFMAPTDMQHVGRKALSAGCQNILLGERGTFFGYGRLVNDLRAIPQDAVPGRSRDLRRHSQRTRTWRAGLSNRREPGDGSSCWPGRPWRSAATACSVKLILIPIDPPATALIWCRWKNSGPSSADYWKFAQWLSNLIRRWEPSVDRFFKSAVNPADISPRLLGSGGAVRGRRDISSGSAWLPTGGTGRLDKAQSAGRPAPPIRPIGCSKSRRRN